MVSPQACRKVDPRFEYRGDFPLSYSDKETEREVLGILVHFHLSHTTKEKNEKKIFFLQIHMLSNGLEIKQIPCFLPVSDLCHCIVVLVLFHWLVMSLWICNCCWATLLSVGRLQGLRGASYSMAEPGSMPTRHPCLY